MNGEVLSRAEVEEITRTPIRVRQLAFFTQNRIPYYVNEYNQVIVLRKAVGAPERLDAPRPVWRSNKEV
ncbi:DUF4224 domain-containing protein [Stenotrophomonas maltophilia]|uniref:DUF4224 domain-containing protein n=1 Tax=Stenotrophomonas maltophilia TaxID=40324 RepID=A0AA41CKV4_STEMA|nr:DUF4224 domain-containing protein [Stenotrophomonas maltophilia]MCU1072685.1 DUF4224 domain-containing protein [Stenotrophomonas maltophilia]OWQ76604.1 DUF4224 domain-containing protein [Stenotrophomonas maltophilia]